MQGCDLRQGWEDVYIMSVDNIPEISFDFSTAYQKCLLSDTEDRSKQE